MSCLCGTYIDCGDKGTVVPAPTTDSNAFGHNYDSTVTCSEILDFFQKTHRVFTASYSGFKGQVPGYIITGCDYPVPCDTSTSDSMQHSIAEYCKRELNVPYFWDRQRGIYVWKSITEELSFDISSTQTALFRQKWGNIKFHKICIPNTVKTVGKEQFLMVRGGIRSVLASVEYTYNPFPFSDVAGGTWGLYGNTVTKTATPDTPNVACILIFPTVPKQSEPLDNDVIHYGFYDYNSIEGGFMESSLPADDGGKDYFYPYWCRSMPTDPIWRETADMRYESIYTQEDFSGSTIWTPPDPTVYPWPFGTFALDSKDHFIASCLLQFGPHAKNNGVIYNHASMGDLFAAIQVTKVPLSGKFSSVYPVTPL